MVNSGEAGGPIDLAIEHKENPKCAIRYIGFVVRCLQAAHLFRGRDSKFSHDSGSDRVLRDAALASWRFPPRTTPRANLENRPVVWVLGICREKCARRSQTFSSR